MDSESREPADLSDAPVCYRHADRATYLSCSRCGRPICAECSYDAAIGQRCIECSTGENRTQVIPARQARRTTTPGVTGLIAVTVVAYLVQTRSPGVEFDFAQINQFVREGEWWRVITAAFLHGSVIHIGFNMYALYLFGPSLERRLGTLPFLAMYFASALAGGVAFLYFGGNGAAVGASGAIFGLFGAWIGASYRLRHTPAGAAQFRSLAVLLLINMALPLMVPNIAWQAHLGGLLAGLIIIFGWLNLAPEPRDQLKRTAIALAVAAVCLLLVFLA